MKNLLIILLLCATVCMSCRTPKQITSDRSDSTSYVEKLKYDTIIIPADSTLLDAYFKCDSLGNVYIARIYELSTVGVNTALNFGQGILNYKTKRDKVVTITIRKNIYHTTKVKETITVTKTIVKMNMFQTIFFWFGLIGVVAAGITLYFKLKK